MSPDSSRRVRYLALRVPVIVLVLAFTAIPTELRRVDAGLLAKVFDFGIDVPDIVANIIGFIPLGIALSDQRFWKGSAIAAAVSVLAETTQLFADGRSSSLLDVLTNVAGAAIGLAVCAAWKRDLSRIPFDARAAIVAAICAVGIGWTIVAQITPEDFERLGKMVIATPPWVSLSARGASMPGRLEGSWSFDAVSNDSLADDSGNGLTGVLVRKPGTEAGVLGRALKLNGRNQWVDLGHPDALRLSGSMTIMAWINSSAFPRDDAAIVSAHDGLGFQLDTTIDQGPRTIGFKLASDRAQLMIRYGRTRMFTNRWYHVAGVYDAAMKTMNVYLNGRPDNGCLSGRVTGRQQISGKKTFIGRRAGERGFEFAGLIDEVRIYSRALTEREIGDEVEHAIAQSPDRKGIVDVLPPDEKHAVVDEQCSYKPSDESPDARVTGFAVTSGLLVAVVCAGVWSSGGWRMGSLLLSILAGVALLPWLGPLVPGYFRTLIPVLSLLGGLSVVASVRERSQ